MRPKHLAVLLLLAAVWGASFIFIKLAVQSAETPYNFPPVTLVSIRIGTAALILYAILKLRGGVFPWSYWMPLLVLGLLNAALPYFLFSWSEQHIDSNLAAIYNATTPLFTVIFAFFVVREERLSRQRSLGVLVGFLGVVYLFSDSVRNVGRSTSLMHVLGELGCVLAAFCYGISNMLVRTRLKKLQSLQLATAQLLFGALWTLPIVAFVERPWRTLAPTPAALGALTILSLFGTAIAQILYFNLLTEVGATRTAQVTYLLPIFGLLWGWLIGETITTRVIGALLIVLLGVLIVNGGTERLQRRKQAAAKAPPAI